jgi:uncharacterized GH25 family protein
MAAAAANLAGRVTFRGKPLTGAVVTATLIENRRAGPVTVTRTDSHGQYVLRNLRNGTYALLVNLNGRRIYQGEIALTGASLTKNIDLE